MYNQEGCKRLTETKTVVIASGFIDLISSCYDILKTLNVHARRNIRALKHSIDTTHKPKKVLKPFKSQ